ncbi:MAG TPA: hypothetical protein VLL52_21960 [Anaerolineae bacterium]|nr:hypothetical protein [Anaerolineae bacterium]
MTKKNTLEGIQFPVTGDGKRSTTAVGKAIIQTALAAAGSEGVQAVAEERDWRHRYPRHLRKLSEVSLRDGETALATARAGLAAAWGRLVFMREGEGVPLAAAMAEPATEAWHTVTVAGEGGGDIRPWGLPYEGDFLQGDKLRRQIDKWEEESIIEPSHGEALRRVLAHPEWFDLSDRTVVLLGAGSEAGPLKWLAGWRANVVALDLPRPGVWEKIVGVVRGGNGRLLAPVSQPVAADAEPESWFDLAGADLLTQTPEIGQWLSTLDADLDMAAIAYLDGERHMRVSVAMDAIMSKVSETKPASSLMYMATPTDVFAVHEETARMAMAHYESRHVLRKAAALPLQGVSGGRLLQPHVTELITSANGKKYGLVDCLVIEQGPNYALAKRLQQWRAVVARAEGQRVSLNVAPSTTTQSVIKNRALKAGFDGASMYGVEVFAPETTNALMAAMWVHDLRYDGGASNPETVLDHPLELLMEGANHGGLWRAGYLPRTALPLAAVVGFVKGSLGG